MNGSTAVDVVVGPFLSLDECVEAIPSWAGDRSESPHRGQCQTGAVTTPEPIEPDTKDWTWVLSSACAECGFDAASVQPTDVADRIRDGKLQAAGALIGAVMKEMRGQADAGRVRELVLEKLGQ